MQTTALNDGFIKTVEATLSRDLLTLLQAGHVTHDHNLRPNPVNYKRALVDDAGVMLDLTVKTAEGEAQGFINLTRIDLLHMMAAVDHLIKLRGQSDAA